MSPCHCLSLALEQIYRGLSLGFLAWPDPRPMTPVPEHEGGNFIVGFRSPQSDLRTSLVRFKVRKSEASNNWLRPIT